MSQAGVLSGGSGGSGGTGILDITGNSGGAVGADGANNINLVGSGAITVAGNAGTNTLTITTTSPGPITYTEDSGSATPAASNLNILGTTAQGITTSGAGSTVTLTIADWTTTQKGVGVLATNAETIAGTSTTKVVTPDDLKAKLGTQTNHTVALFQGNTAALIPSNAGTNGQVLLGSTGADPSFATLTSSDSSISFTTGAGSLSLQVAGGSTAIKTITGNSGGAQSPSAGNFNVLGTGSITVAGTANTQTVQLTGLTNHSVMVGAGTATVTMVAPGAQAGVALVSNGAAVDPSFTTVIVAGGGTGRTTLNSGAVLSGNGGGNVLLSNAGSAGQVFIAQSAATSGQYITATAGTGLTLTANASTFQYGVSGGGLAWVDSTGATQTIAIGTGYLADRGGGVAFTLPASATIGDVFRIVGLQGSWTLAQAAGQQIKIAGNATTVGVGGSLASSNAGDCIECVATNTSASTVWRVMSFIGTITVV